MGSTSNAGSPSSSLPASGQAIIADLTYGTAWTDPVIQYHLAGAAAVGWDPDFQQAYDSRYNAPADATFAFAPQMRRGFEMIDSVVALDFAEIVNPGVAQNQAELILVTSDDAFNPVTLEGFHQYPGGPTRAPGDFWSLGAFTSDNSAMVVPPELGGGEYLNWTLLHEIGHGLGILHPFDNAGAYPSVGSALDNERYTVMSYTAASSASAYGHAVTLMALDIAVLQTLYGAESYATGNSFYTLTDQQTTPLDLTEGDVSIGRAYYSIWDSGGTDTIDYAGGASVLINLNAATLDRMSIASDAQNAILSAQSTAFFGTLDSELVTETINPDYHAGGFFSRVLGGTPGNRSGVDGGFSIAYGAEIENATGGMQADFLIGNHLNNRIVGNSGNDEIVGGAGSDALIGGGGNDTMRGDEGNDTLNGGAGNDRLFGDSTYSGGGGATLTMGSGTADPNDTVAVPNAIRAGETAIRMDTGFSLVADPDIASATTVPHMSISRAGDGTFDYFVVALPESAAITFDIDLGDGNGPGDVDTYLRLFDRAGNQVAENDDGGNDPGSNSNLDSMLVTNLTAGTYFLEVAEYSRNPVPAGSTFELHLSVDLTGADVPAPGFGSDNLNGGAGDDDLFGQNGNDRLNGGLGADDLFGGAGVDTAYYATATSAVRFGLQTGGTQGEADGDTYSSVENAIGSNYGDVISGTSTRNVLDGGGGFDVLFGRDGNDVLRGGAGNDRLEGGAGADQIVGGSGRDIVSYTTATSGVRLDIAAGGGGTLGDAAGDTFSGISSVIGSGFNDQMWGFAGVNVMNGGNGNDFIDAREGNDVLNGGNGSDRLNGGLGNDRITTGTGVDVLVLVSGHGLDRVLDFEDGVDRFDYQFHSGVGSFGDLTVTRLGATGHAIIADGAGSRIIADDMWGLVDASDFLF